MPGWFAACKTHNETSVRKVCLYVSDNKLTEWGTDPVCLEMEICARILEERRIRHQSAVGTKRAELQQNPFDPRTEVSADARHIAGRIVMHLWIICVLCRWYWSYFGR